MVGEQALELGRRAEARLQGRPQLLPPHCRPRPCPHPERPTLPPFTLKQFETQCGEPLFGRKGLPTRANQGGPALMHRCTNS